MSRMLLGSVGISAALVVALAWQGVSLRRDLRALEQSNRALEAQVQKLKSRPAPAPRVAAPAPSSAPAPERAAPPPEMLRSLAQKNEAISKLQDDLAAARAQIGALENSLLTLKGANASLDQQSRDKLAAAEAACNQRLADAAHAAGILQADLESGKRKIAQLEEANNALKSQAAAPKPSARNSELAAQLRDIAARRESYLRSVIRRYRDISSQYRSFSGALAGRQDQQTGPWNSAELSRIQSAISAAEDDLRQLDSLNAQAALLEKKLARN